MTPSRALDPHFRKQTHFFVLEAEKFLTGNTKSHCESTISQLIPRTSRLQGCYSNACQRLRSLVRILTTMAEEADIERCDRETQMMENVREFLEGGCKCSRGPKDSPCSSQFTVEEIMANLNNCQELSSRELDLVILANIQAVTRVETVGQKRSRSPRCNFLFQSKPICRDMFLFMYGISDSRLRRLREHYENSGQLTVCILLKEVRYCNICNVLEKLTFGNKKTIYNFKPKQHTTTQHLLFR